MTDEEFISTPSTALVPVSTTFIPSPQYVTFFISFVGIVNVSPVIAVKPLRNLNPHVEYSTFTLQYLDESTLV